MTNQNKVMGNRFEKELCQYLFDRGFWCHDLAQNTSGQPFDVIAARNGRSHPIDCKLCATGVFSLHRVEENQYYAMALWRNCGNGEGWFALKFSDGEIFMVSFSQVERLLADPVPITRNSVPSMGIALERWVKTCE